MIDIATNVLVRYVARDDAGQSRLATACIEVGASFLSIDDDP